jgi:hypothetical protein
MNLDEIKIKRLTEGKKAAAKKGGGKKVRTSADGTQTYAKEDAGSPTPSAPENVVVEGAKEHKTPKFVQHCVAAITADPARLADVEKRKDGSPFAICNARLNSNPALAAKHSQGKHHTVKDYEKALVKLRETTDKHAATNVRPASVAFDPDADAGNTTTPTKAVRFNPRA